MFSLRETSDSEMDTIYQDAEKTNHGQWEAQTQLLGAVWTPQSQMLDGQGL